MTKSLWRRSSLHVKGLIVFAVSLLPLWIAFLLLMISARDDARTDRRITALRQSHEAAHLLLGAAVDAETGIRGYVATGNPVFLGPYERVVRSTEELAAAARSAGLGRQELELLGEQYEILMTLREDGASMSRPELEALLLRGKASMDRIRSLLGSLVEQQEAQREAALARREQLHSRTNATLWFGALGGAVGGALGIMLFAREIAQRVRLLQRNSRRLESGDPMAPIGGNDEIAELGRTLEETSDELVRKERLRREAEARMAESRDEADRANRAKSEFLSRMSHELRTPLNAVLGFAQLLELDDLGPEQHDHVHHIVRGGRHLLSLINEVLDISRIDSGTMSLSVEPVDVRRVVQESVALAEPLATECEVVLKASLPADGTSHAMADQQRLKQIILNLLSNAIKYNVPGGSVDVGVSRDGEWVRVVVADTGPGLTPEQLRELFTPFNRLGAEATNIEGTGLGLALSKGLAEAMGGAVSATSRFGKGATFTLSLAAAEAPAKASERQAASAVAGSRDGPAATVLYIEDNASNLELVRGVLARRPHVRLLTAALGSEGIELARDAGPSVILLDLNLPDVQGDEVLEILRRDPATAAIPVVVLSADATTRQVARLEAAGAAAYLTKPLDVKRLLTLLDEMLGQPTS